MDRTINRADWTLNTDWISLSFMVWSRILFIKFLTAEILEVKISEFTDDGDGDSDPLFLLTTPIWIRVLVNNRLIFRSI